MRRRNMVTSGFKKICFIIASGVPGLEKARLSEWLSQQPELDIIASIESVFVFGGHSADSGPELWLRLAEAVRTRLDRFDGFVVIHDIDNLLYTSAALSFMLQGITKPVIFTGNPSNVADAFQVGFKANLINAAQVASYDIPEVCLMLGNRLLRANQTSIISDATSNILSAPLEGILGRIDFSIRIFDKLLWKHTIKLVASKPLDAKLETIRLSPLIDLKVLAQHAQHRDALLVNAHTYHSLPQDLSFLFAKITTDTPVIIWSKLIRPGALDPKNVIMINNMTWPATAVKTMWVLSQTKAIKKIRELMTKNVAGEIIQSI